MTLIEGLGDEVTLVLGSFIIIVILLLAWLSTHTEEIPLIREIVVELRMRNRHQEQIGRDQPPQDVEIPQSSREGIPNVEQEEVRSNSMNLPGDVQTEDQTDVLRSDMEAISSTQLPESSSEISSSGETKSSSHSHAVISTATPDLFQTDDLSQTMPETDDCDTNISENKTSTDVPMASVLKSHSLISETEEETLRRRRVQYFQSGASALHVENDNRVSGDQKLEGSTNVMSDSKQKVSVSSDDCQKSESRSYESVRQSAHCPEDSQRSSNSAQRETHRQIENSQELPDGDSSIGSQIRVRLKYMNETQRFVYASPADTIGDFRRTHFQSELQDNKWVRFIFNGQDLRDDARTLQACNIENNCTMHCLVTSRQRPRERTEAALEEEEETILGTMMYPLFTLLLLIVWYFRIFYRQYFSALSTVCLIGITFLLALSYLSSFRTSEAAAAATATATTTTTNSQTTSQASAGGNDSRQTHPHSD